MENTGGPSRFDLPEIEELTLGVFSSFDDITYNTKPIAQAPEQICSDTRKDYEETRNSISGMFESLIGDENYIKIQGKKDDSSDGDSIEQDSILKIEDFRTASIKKVRFDFDAEENLNKSYNTHSNTSENADDNHAKIVREVLKKYPYLVRHNKNIRLKIMQKESKTNENLTQNKTKVSYLVLKSDSLMTNDDNEALSKNLNDCYLETNDIGPWKCSRCNLDQQYSNYYMYRRHMQDVHSERFDPRICEHCGYKATKRNILMYHMYTKHNVPPPRNMSFPKCEVCSYVALSESLLIRHQINHRHQLSPSNLHRLNTKSIECSQYEGSLSNTTESTYHEITTAHGTSLNRKQKEHRCLYCGKQFSKMHNLESHIGCHHNNLEKYECVSELQPSSESSTEVEAFRNIPCDIATSVNIGNESQQSNINDKELSISQVNNDDPINQQIVMLINNEEYQHQYFKDDYPFNISTNDEILVRHSDGNVIIYIENTNENQSSEELSKNVVNKNCEYPHSNNDIVEEVVEELEAIEDDKVEKIINHTNSQIMFKEEVDICRADYGFDLNRMKNNSSDFGETIQYVEEETEILEYETSSNV